MPVAVISKRSRRHILSPSSGELYVPSHRWFTRDSGMQDARLTFLSLTFNSLAFSQEIICQRTRLTTILQVRFSVVLPSTPCLPLQVFPMRTSISSLRFSDRYSLSFALIVSYYGQRIRPSIVDTLSLPCSRRSQNLAKR